ncbi:MAG: hypothetical protein E7270_04625 [Lachnospiraceae bacterium]|nr:hypothetical protein [Lachnospiraceae bacterium]
MMNIFFENEEVTENDLYFMCYMIERVARKIKQKNRYVVNNIDKKELTRLICLANVLHCENPLKVEDEWINDYNLVSGDFDVTDINPKLETRIPTETQMGKVYTRLIVDTLKEDEDYIQGLIRVYNDSICDKLDDYDCGAYYEPSYFIARAYNEGGF